MSDGGDTYFRRLPHNVEAEMAVLGAILIDNLAYHRVAAVLQPEHFAIVDHAVLYDACKRLIERGMVADPITLKGELSNALDQAGGVGYLIKLADCAVTRVNAAAYARSIFEDAERRRLIEIGEDIVNRGYAGAEAPADIAAAAIGGLDCATSSGSSLSPIDLAAWEGIEPPARDWIVQDWVPSGCVTALYGDGGTGKSLLAQLLATACATGGTWLGLPVARCPVIGLFCEDDSDELIGRQAAINAALGVGMRDLCDLDLNSRIGCDNLLMTFDRDGRGMLTSLWHEVRRAAIRRGARLIVVDTAADTFGGDEISRPQVRQFISTCLGRLALDIGGAVLLCAHPSVRGMADGTGSGGSTAWSNTVRSRLYLTRPDGDDDGQADPDTRVLARRKANYARVGDTIALRWENGVFAVESGPDTGMVGSIERRTRERAAEDAFICCLSAINAQGRATSAAPSAANFAPKVFLRMAEHDNHGGRDLKAAMERLFAAGRIAVRPYQKQNRHMSERIEVVSA